MKIEDRLLDGLKAGVKRHWRYTKELLKIKPEYLLTISVADELTEGFDSFHGMDVQIKLEESTKSIVFEILSRAIGLKKWFKEKKPKISRKGNADIFAVTSNNFYVIEIKGFDPSTKELNKEFTRLQEFLAINGGINNLASCHVTFPTSIDRSQWIHECAEKIIDQSATITTIKSLRVETDEDPEDGIPCYYVNCVTLAHQLRDVCGYLVNGGM